MTVMLGSERTTRLSTSAVDTRDGFDYWNDAVSSTFVPLECRTNVTDVFRGELILRSGPAEALEERRFRQGESVHIPPGLVHQIEAVEDSDVLEASTPELDDLVRLQDRYGRG